MSEAPDPSRGPEPPGRLARFERWLEAAVHRPGAFWWLLLATALENTVVPLTVEPVVVPLMAIYRDRILPFALAMTLGCIVGGVVMYGVGLGLTAGLAPWWEGSATAAEAATFVERLEGEGFWAIFIFSITPLPFQAATLGAGIAGYPFGLFLLAIVVGRGLLYAGFALGVFLLGTAFAQWVGRYKSAVVVGGSVAGFAAVATLVLLGL
jgi:membrane protein YqaA with SNARE-associated domain